MIRELTAACTLSAIFPPRFALISPGTVFASGRCVAQTRWIPAARAFDSEALHAVEEALPGGLFGEEVLELVDHDHPAGEALGGGGDLVVSIDVLHLGAIEALVAILHLDHEVVELGQEGLGVVEDGALEVGGDGGGEVAEGDALGVDQREADGLGRMKVAEAAHDPAEQHRFSAAGLAPDEQVAGAPVGEIADDRLTVDPLADHEAAGAGAEEGGLLGEQRHELHRARPAPLGDEDALRPLAIEVDTTRGQVVLHVRRNPVELGHALAGNHHLEPDQRRPRGAARHLDHHPQAAQLGDNQLLQLLGLGLAGGVRGRRRDGLGGGRHAETALGARTRAGGAGGR